MVNDDFHKFQNAILEHDEKTLRFLTRQRGFNPNQKAGEIPLLNFAVVSHYHAAVVVLSDHILTNLNQRDKINGMTALSCAWDQPKTALYLISRQADPTIADYKGNTLLHRVVGSEKEWRQELIQAILKHPKTDVFAKNKNGQTAYDLASESNKKLLEKDKRVLRWLALQNPNSKTAKTEELACLTKNTAPTIPAETNLASSMSVTFNKASSGSAAFETEQDLDHINPQTLDQKRKNWGGK